MVFLKKCSSSIMHSKAISHLSVSRNSHLTLPIERVSTQIQPQKAFLNTDLFMPNNEIYLNEDCAKLTEVLGNQLLEFDEINDALEKYPKAQGRIGCLPIEWIKKIPKESFMAKMKAFQDGFGEIARDLRKNHKPQGVEMASNKINNLFHDMGILSDTKKVSIKKLDGEGCWGMGYLIDGDIDKPLVMKVYFCIQEPNDNFGNLLENNKALYWHKNAGDDTQFPNFHYADLDNGFLIDQYISDFMPPVKKIVEPESIGLRYCDINNNKNQKCGYIFDYGCLSTRFENIVRDPETRNTFKKIYDTPIEKRRELIKSILENKKEEDYCKKICELDKALDFFPEYNHDLLKLEIKGQILINKLKHQAG